MGKIFSSLYRLLKLIPFLSIYISLCSIIIFGDIGGLIISCIAYVFIKNTDKRNLIGIIIGIIIGTIINNYS